MYMADYSGRMPPEAELPAALQAYSKNEQIHYCPSAQLREEDRRHGWEADGDFVSDYDFAPWVQADDPAETLLVRDDAPRHVGHTWLAARLDGAVQRYDEDDFDLVWGDWRFGMGGAFPDEMPPE